VHVALGVPTDAEPADDYLMDKGAYVVSYNPKRNVPNWVSWKLDRSFLGKLGRHDKFLQDRTLPPGFVRVSSADYAHSGFDRGHMCPSADRNGNPNDNVATFLMTNMQPQLHELNAGPWKDLEEHGRSLARTGKVLFIVAGGVFGPAPRTIGRAAVAVPDANYKVLAVLEPGQGAADVNPSTPVLAALMPNKAGVALRPWRDYVVSVDQLEQATSYDFLSNVAVAVQQVLESRVASP
jgi:endonuclease G